MTPKKKKIKQNIAPLDKLLNEITKDGKLKNISKLYDTLFADDKERIENNVILHLDIYKKFLIEIVDEIPTNLYRRLEARRVAIVELDKKIKIKKLLAVHLVNSPHEIDQLIIEANRIVFSTTHRHVALMAGRVNEVSKETIDAWDVFFVEKEKQEELLRRKTIRVYQKDRDKGKGKVGGSPSLKITDNLTPPPSDTPLLEAIDNQSATKSMETPLEDTNLEFEVLYTMNIDTQEVNVVVDREATQDKKKDVTTESSTVDVEVEVNDTIHISTEKPTQTEQTIEETTSRPLEEPVDKTEKQSGEPTMDSAEVQTEK